MKCPGLPICTSMWEKLLSLEVDLVPSTGAVSTKRGMIKSENMVSENVVTCFQFIQKEGSNRIGFFISLGNLEKIPSGHTFTVFFVWQGKKNDLLEMILVIKIYKSFTSIWFKSCFFFLFTEDWKILFERKYRSNFYSLHCEISEHIFQ